MTININKLTEQLNSILKANAPVRTSPLGATKLSPYPGNLKNNGIVVTLKGNTSTIVIGGERAPYAEYTEYRSHRRGWMEKSKNEFVQNLITLGGKLQ